jgi:hypothetical protein
MLSLNMKKKESITSVSDVPKIALFEEAREENTGKRRNATQITDNKF